MKSSVFKTLVLALVVAIGLLSCEVGLGPKVDTAAPQIEILTPEVNTVHAKNLIITGTANDETAVRSVSINLLENGKAKYSYPANLDKTTGKWSVEITTKSDTENVVDGKYEIQAIATDVDGKTQEKRRSIQIDNTAPTVLVTSPALFDENKATFFRQLRVSGSCYDASERDIKSVKVYFYAEDDLKEAKSIDLEDETKFVSFPAEGTNSWELNEELPENHDFFKDGKIYNFFVIAEDQAGNKNTYFYRTGDFYSKNVITDANKDDNDDYIPFPSMVQIGKFDQGLGSTVEKPTSNLSKEGLDEIRVYYNNIQSNNTNFLYRSQSASSISWGNIEHDESGNPKKIPLQTGVTGQIKSTDGSSIITNSVEVWLYSAKDEKEWQLKSEDVTLDTDSLGMSVGFNLVLKDYNGELLKSGNYYIRICYKTIASQNFSPLESEAHEFAISAGLPILTETNLSGGDSSPINLQFYTNVPEVILGGEAKKGDGTPAENIIVRNNGVEFDRPKINEKGEWSLTLTEVGYYELEISVEDSENKTTINRAVIIDRTKPSIENMSFYQSTDMNTVTVSAFLTDENSFKKIEYAFIKVTDEIEESDWKEAKNKNSLNETIKAEDFGETTFAQEKWLFAVRAEDIAGNIAENETTAVLDIESPKFSGNNVNGFATTEIPASGYLNKDFYYIQTSVSDEEVIATDNYEIDRIELVAKKNGVPQTDYGKVIPINKKVVTKADITEYLPVINISDENEAKWTVSIAIIDLNGNKSEKTFDFTIDKTPSTFDITKVPQKDESQGDTFEFRGSANDAGSGLGKLYLSFDGTNWPEEYSLDAQKTWSKDLTIAKEGPGTIYAKTVDIAGNMTDVISKDFTFDKTKPTLTISCSEEWATGKNFELSGTASDTWGLPEGAVTVTQKFGSNTIELTGVTLENGTWTIGDLPRKSSSEKQPIAEATNGVYDGVYEYEIKVTDLAGKTSSSKTKVTVDTKAPTIDNMDFYQTIDMTTVNLSAFLSDENSVEKIEYQFAKESEGIKDDADSWKQPEKKTNSFKQPIEASVYGAETFAQEKWIFAIRATDKAGNETQKEIIAVLDFDSPTLCESGFVSTAIPTSGYLTEDFYFIEETVSGETVIATDNYEIDRIEVVAKKNGIKQDVYSLKKKFNKNSITRNEINELSKIDAVKENEGKWTVSIAIVDLNENKTEKTIDFSIDVTKPKISFTDVPEGKDVQGDTFEFRGKSSDEGSGLDKIYLSFDGVNWPEDKSLDAQKIWSKDLSIVAEGKGKIFAKVVDIAGNESEVISKDFTFDKSYPDLDVSTQGGNPVWATGKNFELRGTASDTLGFPEVGAIKVTQTCDSNTIELTGVKLENGTWTIGDLPRNSDNTKKENLEDSVYIYEITVTDLGGKEVKKTVTVKIDKQAPYAPSVKTPIENGNTGLNAITAKTYKFSGESSDKGDSATGMKAVEYAIKTANEPPADSELRSVTTDGNWNFTNETDLAEDKYYLYIRSVDNADNKSDYATVEFDVDYANPVVKVTSPESDKQKAIFKFAGQIYDTKVLRDTNPIEITQRDSNGKTISVSTTVDKWKDIEFPLKAENEASPKDGTYAITIKATDWCGKTTSVSRTIKLDTQAPTIEVQNPTGGSTFTTRSINVKGSLRDDSVISGVYYAVATTQPSIPTDKINGDWSGWTKKDTQYSLDVPLNFDRDGYKTLYLVAVDELGNDSEVTTINFLVDATAPTLKLDDKINVKDTNYTNSTFKVSGTATDEIGLKEVVIKSGANTLKTIPETEIWSYTIPEGELPADIATNIVVTAIDKAGNEVSCKPFNVYRDTKAPEIVLKNLTSKQVITEKDLVDGKFTVKGSWNDNGGSGTKTLEYLYDGSDWTNCENVGGVNWEVEIPLTEETLTKTIYFRATDDVENKGESTITEVTVDTSVPKLEVSSSDNQNIGSIKGSYTFEGKAKDTLSLDRIEVVITKDDVTPGTREVKYATDKEISYSKEVTDEGKWVFTIKAYDKAGRESEVETRTVSIDKQAPEAPTVKTPSGNTGLNAITEKTYIFSGTSLDKGNFATGIKAVEYVIKSQEAEPADSELRRVTTNGNWNFTNETDLAEGKYYLYIRSVDNAENKSGYTTVEFDVDYDNPTVDITSPTEDKLNKIFKFAGQIEDSKALRDTNPIEITQKDSNGKTISVSTTVDEWQNIDFPLKAENEASPKDGTYAITIKATDWCGKTTSVSRTIKLDTQAPTIEVQNLTEGSTFTTRSINVKGSLRDDSVISGVYYAVATTQPSIPTDKINGDWSGWKKEDTQYSLDVTLNFDSDGYKTLYLVAVDELGNCSEVTTRNFLVDATAPELSLAETVFTDKTNFTSGSFIVSGNATDNIGLKEVEIISGNESLGKIEASKFTGNEWKFEIKADKLSADIATNIVIKAIDKAGNETSTLFNVYKDTKGPEIVLKNISNGTIISKNSSQDKSFTVNGSWNDNGGSGIGDSATIEYSFDNSNWYTIYDGAEQSWSGSINLPTGQGSKVVESLNTTIYFRATDAIGNKETYEISNVKIDTGIPTIKDNSASGGKIKQGASWTLSGTADDTLAINKVEITATKNDGTSKDLSTFTAENDTTKSLTWSIDLTSTLLEEGEWTISIKAFDKVGRESSTLTKTVLVDTTAPKFETPTISDPISGDPISGTDGKDWYKNQTIKISGELIEANGIESIKYSIDGKTTWTTCDLSKGKTYTFTANIPVEQQWKDKTIYFEAVDTVGNSTTDALTGINVDRNNPTISITSENTSLMLNGKSDITVNFTLADDGSGLDTLTGKIGNTTLTGKIDGTAGSVTIKTNDIGSLPDQGTILFEVTDKTGKPAQTSLPFQKDTKAPVIEITSHTTGSNVNKTITLKGSTTEDKGLKETQLWINGSNVKTYYGTDGFSWSYSLNTTKYLDGNLPIKVIAIDNVNNETTLENFSLNVDQESDRPIITINNVQLGKYLVGQTKVFGSVSDDDGNIEKLYISSNGTTFPTKVVDVDNGSFSYDVGKVDGDKTLYFKVIDKDGNTFITTLDSTDNLLAEPYLKTEGSEVLSNVPLTFKLDTNPPVIGEPKIKAKGESKAELFTNNMEVGGTKKVFTIFAYPTDGNGIKEVYLSIEGRAESIGADLIETEDGTEYWKMEVDTEDIDLANLQFTITAEDYAGVEASLSRNILVDNTSPTFKVESHSENEQVTGRVKLVGTTSDDVDSTTGSGVKSVQWLITEKANVTKSNEEIIIKDGLQWHDVKGTLSWNYQFEGLYELSKYVKDSPETYADEALEGTNVWKLPIYFKIVDDVGNTTIEEFVLNVDPDGDKPTAEITYPETADSNEDALGGTIRIFGTAKDNVAVTEVHMQIDCDGDGDFDETDKDKLKGQMNGEKPIYDVKESGEDWYIVADGKTSWNMTINSKGEFEPTKENTVNTINIRVRAKDNKEADNLGVWSSPVKIIVDKNAPRIGSSNPLRLVQYTNNSEGTGAEISSIDYTPDMWIKGNWWLVGSVEDESNIQEFTLDNDSGSNIELSSSNIVTVNDIWEDEKLVGYTWKILLNTEDKSGKVAFTLEALDATNARASANISIKFDNTAPTLSENLKHGEDEIGKDAVITQSNNAYEIKSYVTESGSGFSKLAIFFKRTLKNGTSDETYIYNPAITKGEDGNKVTEVSSEDYSVVFAANDLPRLVIKEADDRPNNEEIQDASLINNDNIRKGGLVRIGGMERQITGVDKDTGTVTFTPPASTDYKKAEFAYALVVDNFKVENATEYDSYGNPIKFSNDDGDKVVESVEKNGATYDWTLSINSKNIPDGIIDICYIAYDEAGNCSELKTVRTSVQNNRPAIARVWLGTDLNGDGNITEDEEVAYRKNFTTKNAEYEVPIDTTAPGETLFTAKGMTTIRPEIVGGNNSLWYKHWDDGNAEGNTEGLKQIKCYGSECSHDKECPIMDKSIVLNVESGKLDGVGDTTSGYDFKYGIWDYTDGSTPGDPSTGSQWAKITVTMAVDVVDGDAPEVVINDLYWNSKLDNSLYRTRDDEGNLRNDGTENGHIDLKADLPELKDTFIDEIAGIYDRDDKVSGKITFTGTAYDDVCLNSLSFSFAEFKGSASFVKTTNTWDNPKEKIADDGWEFSVKFVPEDENEKADIYLDQRGHRVEWTLSIDTAKIEKVAAADVKLVVSAVDHTEKDSNKAETEKQVDVVPYITGVKTSLSELEINNPSVYARSALGQYPIYYYKKPTSGSASSEKVILEGFNISTKPTVESTVYFTGENASITLDTNKAFTLPEAAKSGEIYVEVNGIKSLNNINNNDAKLVNKDYENAYNRQPNGQNNDLLTDDVEIAIWEINSKAAIAETGELSEVTMHVNPVNGMLGFSFAHSQDLASYPNGNTNSYETWITDWTAVNHVNFVYDKNGNMYGTNGGTDTYTPNKKTGRLGLISSYWGPIANKSQSNDWYSGYTKKNRLRLEYLGMTRDGVYASNVFRFAKGSGPQLATRSSTDNGTNDNGTNLYMLYYDNTLGELKFKAGNFGSDTGKKIPAGDGDTNNDKIWEPSVFKFGDFADDAVNEKDNAAGKNYLGNYKNISVIANQSGANGNASVRPGIYYSVSAVSSKNDNSENGNSENGNSDVAVAVWYDEKNKSLWYSYLVNPLANAGKRAIQDNDSNKGVLSSEWSTPVKILDGHAGGYCAIKGDDDGHIHIAAFSRKNAGSLYYAYLEDYKSAATVVAVDSYGSAGQYITMEFAKNSDGKTIPYIGYWMNSMSYPKYAYLTDTGFNEKGVPKAGVDDKNMYTGAWETIMLPTTSSIVLDDINIGVWKNDDGKLNAIPQRTDENPDAKSGIAGGNGTSNPVLGYGIVDTGYGYIETAQLK